MEIRSTPTSLPTADKGAPAQEVAPGVKAAAQPVQQKALVQQPDAVVSQKQLSEALESINKALRQQSPGLEFSVDEDTDRTIVRVIDTETNEVIRQMPTREALEISKAIERMQSLLVNQKA